MTVTSNIHINLPGWSNATYSVGQRRNNGGNAYQVITAGTSTAPPSGTASDIAPGGTSHWKWLSAIDYTTLQAWANGIPATLTQPVIGQIWNNNVPTVTATAGAAILTLSGHTTSNTNTITLQPAPGEGFQTKYLSTPTTAFYYGAANGVAIECPASGFGGINYVQVNDAWVIFQGLQFKDNNLSSGATIVGGTGSHLVLSQCIFEGQTQSGGASIIQIGGATGLTITNCLVIDHDTAATGGTVGAQATTGTVVANNTFVQSGFVSGKGCLDSGTNVTSGNCSAVNNIFVNFDAAFMSVSGTPWSTNHNAFTNASFAGNNGTDTGASVYSISAATTFIGATSDFHLKTGSPCLNVGATDTTDIPAAIDIVNTSRPQGTFWDIGAHELLAGISVARNFVVPAAFNAIVIANLGDQTPFSAYAAAFSSDFGSTFLSNGVPLEWSSTSPLPLIGTANVPIEWSTAILGRDFPLVQEVLESVPSFIIYDPFSTQFSSQFGPISNIGIIVDPFNSEFNTEFGPLSSINYATDPSVPIEWSGSIPQPTRDALVPLEWRATTSASSPAPIEWRRTLAVDTINPIHWTAPYSTSSVFPVAFDATVSSSSVGADDVIFIEWRSQIQRDAITPFDFLGFTGIVVDRVIPIFWLATTQRDIVTYEEVIRTYQASADTPIEWRSLWSSTTVFPVDFKTSRSVDAPVFPIDWRGVATTVDVSMPVAFVSSLDISRPAVIESVASVIANSRFENDTLSSIALTRVNPLEFSLSAGQSITVPLEMKGAGSTSADYVMSLDWRSITTTDVSSGIEFRTNFQSDIPVGVNTLTTGQADGRFEAAWNGAIDYSYTIIGVEWNHELLDFLAEATMSMEILSTVFADATSIIQMRFGRRSLGSQLEPDNWEWEHEPPAP